jgi:hypothetical protein
MFFILHGINDNFGLIPAYVIVRLSTYYFIITLGIVGLSLLLLRKADISAVFSFYLLSIFFLFGPFHDFLKSVIKNKFFVSYTFLLLLILIITVVFFISLIKRKKINPASMRYFYYLVGIFAVLETGITIKNIITNRSFDNNLRSKTDKLNLTSTCLDKGKPDIFFVVFDSYPSSKCLREDFDYDNGKIDSLLKDNHFFVSSLSRSNYNLTAFSLCSTMDLDYLEKGVEGKIANVKRTMEAMGTLKSNALVNFLKQQAYKIENYGCFDFDEMPSQTKPFFWDWYYSQIDDQTLYSRIKRDIAWSFTLKNIFTGAFQVPKSYKTAKAYHIYRNNYNLNGLIKELSVSSDTPRFIYTHVILPHNPYYLDSNGKEVSDTALLMKKTNTKAAFLDQVKYANILLKKIIPLIAKPSSKPRVVIIEGDHGFRDFGPEVPTNRIFMNLNTYYFSDGDYSQLYDGISPVNSFRVVLNKYFCQSLPMLKDSSVYLIDKLKK